MFCDLYCVRDAVKAGNAQILEVLEKAVTTLQALKPSGSKLSSLVSSSERLKASQAKESAASELKGCLKKISRS